MTVMQRTMKNSLEYSGLVTDQVNIFQASKLLKKIAYFTKITLLTLASMSLSFYLVFIR